MSERFHSLKEVIHLNLTLISQNNNYFSIVAIDSKFDGFLISIGPSIGPSIVFWIEKWVMDAKKIAIPASVSLGGAGSGAGVVYSMSLLEEKEEIKEEGDIEDVEGCDARSFGSSVSLFDNAISSDNSNSVNFVWPSKSKLVAGCMAVSVDYFNGNAGNNSINLTIKLDGDLEGGKRILAKTTLTNRDSNKKLKKSLTVTTRIVYLSESNNVESAFEYSKNDDLNDQSLTFQLRGQSQVELKNWPSDDNVSDSVSKTNASGWWELKNSSNDRTRPISVMFSNDPVDFWQKTWSDSDKASMKFYGSYDNQDQKGWGSSQSNSSMVISDSVLFELGTGKGWTPFVRSSGT